MSLDRQIAVLRQMGEPLLPPASAEDLSALRSVLLAELPHEVEQLYTDHGGCLPGSSLPLRLLAPDEACATIPSLRDFGVPFAADELGVFWADDNSNYAGVFTAGALRGRVYLLDHEEPSPEPRWRDVESFYDCLLEAASAEVDWYDMRTDYPRNFEHLDDVDDDLAARLFALYLDDPEGDVGLRAGFQALAMSASGHTDSVLALLRSDDMWIQERAAQILGGWRWADAVEPLAEVARTGSHNGRLAAVRALQRIPTRDARSLVNALREELGPNYAPYFR